MSMKFCWTTICRNETDCQNLLYSQKSLILIQSFTKEDAKNNQEGNNFRQKQDLYVPGQSRILFSVKIVMDSNEWSNLSNNKRRIIWSKSRSQLYWSCHSTINSLSLCNKPGVETLSSLTINIFDAMSSVHYLQCIICFLGDSNPEYITQWTNLSPNVDRVVLDLHRYLPQISSHHSTVQFQITRFDQISMNKEIGKVFITNISLIDELNNENPTTNKKCPFFCGWGPECLIQLHDICNTKIDCISGEDEDYRLCKAIKNGVISLNYDLNQSEDNFSESDAKYSSSNLHEMEAIYSEEINYPINGILDEITLKNNLSNLGKTPDGLSYAMLDARLVGMELENIELLKNYKKLQNINVSHNNLSNLDFLEFNENLISIKATNNNLSFIFNHPINCAHFLREIDFSFNKIDRIPDLSIFYFLSKLNLDGNNIKNLNGLANCSRLIYLNVAHNQLESVEPLELCPLNYLNVSYNKLMYLNGIENIIRLQEVIASGNQIKSFEVFNEGHVALYKIDMEHNKIIDIQHLRPLKSLNLLRDINLRHNPITEVPDYRLHVLFVLPNLGILDGNKAEIEEKVKSENFFNPNRNLVAARDHRINCVNRFFKAQTVLYSTLQNSYTPYPMLILVGPKGSGKKWLSRKLVQNFPNFFGLAISHTTQPLYSNNMSSSECSEDKETQDSYQRVSRDEFESMRMKGCFLQTCKIGNYYYGLTVDAVEMVAKEGLAGVIDMELEGVLSLKKTHFEPRYVLTMPLNNVVQESRIRHNTTSPVGLDNIVKEAISRVDMYIEINQNQPGFFDKFICTDDLDEAYTNFKRLVMDYLGLTNEDVTETRTIDANSRLASTGNLTQSRATVSQQKFSSNSQGSASNRAALIEHESLQRRLNTAKAALTKRNKDDSFSPYKTFNRHRTSDFDLGNSDEDISSALSNNPTEISDLGYRSPNQETPASNNELIDDIENSREDLRTLHLSNQSGSSLRSLSMKAPREVQAN